MPGVHPTSAIPNVMLLGWPAGASGQGVDDDDEVSELVAEAVGVDVCVLAGLDDGDTDGVGVDDCSPTALYIPEASTKYSPPSFPSATDPAAPCVAYTNSSCPLLPFNAYTPLVVGTYTRFAVSTAGDPVKTFESVPGNAVVVLKIQATTPVAVYKA